ncbi:MAG: D-tyrosyl-tRNA(Tyr) deacylase, partial [Aquificae bacterium]|nr:D-tyrosyl-tRNA(Tyr) deacylase [Aquificota bacterium]
KLLEKVINLRIFEDEQGRFQYSLLQIGGELMVVSQFTLYADARKGRRPSFERAERPERAKELYEFFVKEAKKRLPKVETGVFGANMEVKLVNYGPVTILLDTEELK